MQTRGYHLISNMELNILRE